MRFRLPIGEVVGIEYFYTPEYTGSDIYELGNSKINQIISVGVFNVIKVTRVK